MKLALVVALSLAVVTSAQRADATVEVPFDFQTHQPIAQVRVNGGRPVPFLFDTGASINVIGETIAGEFGLVPGAQAGAITGGGERSIATRYADAVTLAVPGIEWTGQRAAVLSIGARHYSGFIGAPILMRYAVQFDFSRRIIRLIDPDRYVAPAGAVRIPFELQADLPVVRAMVDAVRARSRPGSWSTPARAARLLI